jgi:hypothetical protein
MHTRTACQILKREVITNRTANIQSHIYQWKVLPVSVSTTSHNQQANGSKRRNQNATVCQAVKKMKNKAAPLFFYYTKKQT